MKYLPPAFIGVCVAQFVGNMKYLPPVFIGVCVAQFVGNMKYFPRCLLGFVGGKYFMFPTN
jgi:hypothetical protein